MRDLYQRMWLRANHNSLANWKEAAEYLDFAMQEWTDDQLRYLPQAAHFFSLARSNFHSLFSFALVTNEAFLQQVLGKTEHQSWWKTARRTFGILEKQIVARSAGLLEIVDDGSLREDIDDVLRRDLSVDREYASGDLWNKGARFIHRSARDYLRDSEDGKHILGHHKTSSKVALLRIFYVALGFCHISCRSKLGSDQQREGRLTEMGSFLMFLAEELLGLSSSHSTESTEMVQSLNLIIYYLQIFLEEHNVRLSSTAEGWNFAVPAKFRNVESHRPHWGIGRPSADVLGLAAANGALPFIKAFDGRVGCGRRLSAAYRNYLLLCATENIGDHTKSDPAVNLWQWLLKEGADPSAKQYNLTQIAARDFWNFTTPLLAALHALFMHPGQGCSTMDREQQLARSRKILASVTATDLQTPVLLAFMPRQKLAPLGSLHFVYPDRPLGAFARVVVEASLAELIRLMRMFGLAVDANSPDISLSRPFRMIRYIFGVPRASNMAWNWWRPDEDDCGQLLSAIDSYLDASKNLWSSACSGVQWDRHSESCKYEEACATDKMLWISMMEPQIDEIIERSEILGCVTTPSKRTKRKWLASARRTLSGATESL